MRCIFSRDMLLTNKVCAIVSYTVVNCDGEADKDKCPYWNGGNCNVKK